jgi:hypothetical protein
MLKVTKLEGLIVRHLDHTKFLCGADHSARQREELRITEVGAVRDVLEAIGRAGLRVVPVADVVRRAVAGR